MDRNRLLVLGANRYNVASIRAARAAGFTVVVADRNPQSPGFAFADIPLPIDIVDVNALEAAIARIGGVDGIVTMAEVGVRPAAALSARLGLPSITRQAAKNATSKAAMRRHWAALGAYSARFEVVSTREQLDAAVQAMGRFPLIVKPDRSFGGSRGVSRIEGPADISSAYEFAMSAGLPGTAIVIEEFLVGTEHSCEVLINHGRTSLLCIGQKIKSHYPYRVDVSVQYPAPFSPEQERDIADMCHRAIGSLGLTQGVAHIEFVYTADGPVLMELGARCGGGHTPQIANQVSGVNEFVEYCRIACGSKPERLTPVVRRGADYRFLVFPPGKLKAVTIPDRVRQHPAVFDVDLTLGPGDTVNLLRTTSDRAGFAVVFGETFDDAVRLSDWVCTEITATYHDGTIAHAYTAGDVMDGFSSAQGFPAAGAR